MRIYEDLRAVQTRVTVVQYTILGMFGFLLVIFWHLQVVRGKYFREQAENNRRRNVPIAAPRGVLLDRNGKILVENRPSFNVVLSPEHAESLDQTVVRLSHLLHMGEAPIRERLPRRGVLTRDVVVKSDASLEDVASIEARRLELPETQIQSVPLRSYPLGTAAAHVLGNVGEVTAQQLQSPAYEGLDVAAGDLVGREGIEAQYNRSIMGRDGQRAVIVNSRGFEVDREEIRPAIVGPSLTLSLDANLQATMEQAFAGRPGSAVALDPRNGEILAMTSIPAYDPNRFTTGIDRVLWNQLSNDPDTPLLNRVIQGQYAPGSVFKIVMTIAALEEGVITPDTTFHCTGLFTKYGEFHCHQGHQPHGTVNLIQAIAQSCNNYFYNVGVKLEIDRIARYAKRLGLGQPTAIDLPHEKPGLVPTPEWKLSLPRKVPWYPGETVSVSIGQGGVTATPLQLARLAAAAATGKLVTPHLVKKVGDKMVDFPAPVELGFKPATMTALRAGMRGAVSPGGTAPNAALPGIVVCGKTGTAQVVGNARLSKKREKAEENIPNGWFVAFAPEQDPRIALAVMVEHGASGAGSAAPIAREIMAQFFGVKLAPHAPQAAPAAEPVPETQPDTPEGPESPEATPEPSNKIASTRSIG